MDAQQASAWISEPRFRPFLDATGGNYRAAVALYTHRALSVPVARRVMSIGTLSRLLKDAEISREELRKLPR
jgi:hypothetical protein